MHINEVDIVVGGQYGSEGKGAVAGALVDTYGYEILIRVAGPNAGHSVIGLDGVKYAFRQIPAAGVRHHSATLYIAPGSEVDMEVLRDEIDVMRRAGIPVEGRLFVSPEATVLEEHHHQREADDVGFGKEGSTRKGVGAARCDRLMRRAKLVRDYHGEFAKMGAMVADPEKFYTRGMLEGTQGYWLGAHAGFYPFCTSSDCRAIDFLAMGGFTWTEAIPIVVFRSFPIRIAGNSGPLQHETTWENIGVPAEYTTVTKKVRRVGDWEHQFIEPALQANRIGRTLPLVAMTFMDYLSPDPDEQLQIARKRTPHPYRLAYVGNGPASGFWV